jgi:hypothetical protein
MTGEPPPPQAGPTKSVASAVLRYLGAYLLGILLAVSLTSAKLTLGGVPLWLGYPILAVVGFPLYYVYLSPAYTFGSSLAHWMVGAVGLVILMLGTINCLGGMRSLSAGRPWLIGLPIGFVGTLGVFFTAAASI